MSTALIRQGRPEFGRFADARDINLADYRHRSPSGATAGWLSRWLGYKRFQYFGILSAEVLAGCAIAHLRHTAVAFVYVYTPAQGMLLEKTWRLPFGLGCRLSDSAVNGLSQLNWGGVRIELGYADAPRRKSLRVIVPGQLEIEAAMDEEATGFAPMSLCTRIGRNGWVYAHKVAAVPATGFINCAERRFDLSACQAYGHHDFSAGYMRRETFWNWACLSGEDAEGVPLGLNVSCGVNETSFSENCYWHAGQLHELGLCQFDYDWDRPSDKPWRISNGDGRLQLEFTPAGAHQERLNLGFVASDFKQIFGRFNGRIERSDGAPILINNLTGFVEDQYAKW